MQQSACNGDALCLSLAESAASLTQFGSETVGQVEHEVGTGCMQHLSQFVVGSLRLGQ